MCRKHGHHDKILYFHLIFSGMSISNSYICCINIKFVNIFYKNTFIKINFILEKTVI